MSLLLALAVQAAAPVPQPMPEVVVIARRLKEWRGSSSSRNGVVRCKTTRSTGDRDLDTIACDTMRWCMASLTPEAAFLGDKTLPAADRASRLKALETRLAACGDDQHQRRVSAMLDARAAARTKTLAQD